MNSHELHSETGRWAVPKTPWMERICHICENRNIEDENHFLLECPAYNHIRSQFHNLCYNTDLPSLLQCQNYSEHARLLSKLFEHRNKILNQNKYFVSLGLIDQWLVSVDVNHHHHHHHQLMYYEISFDTYYELICINIY